jgi:hypothetical protein
MSNVRSGVTMSKFRAEIHGQVAQLVERSPEKAGVGGSSPSLATTLNQLFRTRQATCAFLKAILFCEI